MGDTWRIMWTSLKSVYDGFHPEWGTVIAIISLLLTTLLVVKRKGQQGERINGKDFIELIIFTAYIVFLLGGTLLCRDIGQSHRVEWRLFWSYKEIMNNPNVSIKFQMLYNVLIFIPWGAIVPRLFQVKSGSRVIINALFFSLFIEMTQLILRLGLFELDDIYHNTVGAVLGYGIYRLFKKMKRVVE